jgi:hypothetical protein
MSIIDYIIDYCQFDLEPLHLVISSALHDNVCRDRYDVINALIVAFNKKKVEIFRFMDGRYIKLNQIAEQKLFSYVMNLSEDPKLITYPEIESEYFVFSGLPQNNMP